MDLSIIIVNWNVKPLLERCLASIFRQTQNLDYEIIVVDNASEDGSQEFLRQMAKIKNNLKIILNKDNLGFAKANNQAVQKSSGEFILFLNPDTEILEQAIAKAVRFMRENGDCGIVGCQMIDVDGRIQPSVRNFPTFLSQLLIFLKLHYLFPYLPVLKNYFLYNFNYYKRQEVDQVMGAFLMTKRKILETVGDFDEHFFLWFEEVDFCERAKRAGWKIIYDPSVKIRHFGHQSFRQALPYKKQKIYDQSAIHYFSKHRPIWQVKFLKLIQPLSLFLALSVQILMIFKFDRRRFIKIK